jgi:hypothetical protein
VLVRVWRRHPQDCGSPARLRQISQDYAFGEKLALVLLDNLRGTGRYRESKTSTPLDLCLAFEAVADLNGR